MYAGERMETGNFQHVNGNWCSREVREVSEQVWGKPFEDIEFIYCLKQIFVQGPKLFPYFFTISSNRTVRIVII